MTSRKRLPKFFPIPDLRPGKLLEEPEETEARMMAHHVRAYEVTFHNLNLLFGYFDIQKTGNPADDYTLLAM
jgi:hypothetical protein